MDIKQKLEILAGAAKYDVSCSSSGSNRSPKPNSLGSTSPAGICHTFTPDGRCVSLFKILLTNYCIYDCAYCLNRRSNQVTRAAFTPQEVIDLTINFYRRNYIEGLFLSSAIVQNPSHTMQLIIDVIKKLRTEYQFNGYIHVKAIPGASQELIDTAGLYADRMSVNLELPSEHSLKLLAPEKKKEDIFTPMKLIKNGISSSLEDRKKFRKAPVYVPAGQSTQLIVGATNDSDLDILKISEKLYTKYDLKRVYYSAYVPVNKGKFLPELKNPPTLREHRLYQGDWLLRLYGFKADELLNNESPNFDVNFDPKTTWALSHLHLFPIEINTAPYDMLVRIPGVGIRGAKKIVSSRRIAYLTFTDLKKLGVVLKRAQYFITCKGKYHGLVDLDEDKIRRMLTPAIDLNKVDADFEQLSLFPKQSPVILNPSLLLPNDTTTSLTGEL